MGVIADTVNAIVTKRIGALRTNIHIGDIADIGEAVERALTGHVVETDRLTQALDIVDEATHEGLEGVSGLPEEWRSAYVLGVSTATGSLREALPILAAPGTGA